MAVGIDVFIYHPCDTLEISKILSTRQINSNTHQYAATFKISSCLC